MLASLVEQSAWMQLSLHIKKLLQFLFSCLAHFVLFWVDSRMSFLPKYVVWCIAINFAMRDWHSQKTTGQFTIQVVAKLKRESLCHFRFASSSFVYCSHIQVFCCLGKCLVGFWKGYFNQKRCRRRDIIQTRLDEYQFCTTLFSILIKTVRKLIYLFVLKTSCRMKPCLILDCFW